MQVAQALREWMEENSNSIGNSERLFSFFFYITAAPGIGYWRARAYAIQSHKPDKAPWKDRFHADGHYGPAYVRRARMIIRMKSVYMYSRGRMRIPYAHPELLYSFNKGDDQ